MTTQQLTGITLICALFIAGCSDNTSPPLAQEKQTTEANTTVPSSNIYSGELVETFEAGGYTYAQIKTVSGPLWAAGPVTQLKKGDIISFNGKMVMNNFHSKSLNRDFDTLYFVDAFTVNGNKPDTMTSNPHKSTSGQPAAIVIKEFAKAENGQSIVEILDNKNTLAGKTIKLRGQVSKSTLNILGKNWIHIRDSSSSQDLTITTDAITNIDDIVLVEGTLALNKDYGHGFVYDVIIENAAVIVE